LQNGVLLIRVQIVKLRYKMKFEIMKIKIMKEVLLSIFVLTFWACASTAQPDFEKLSGTMNNFMKGTSHNMPDLIMSTFAENATLYLTVRDGSLKKFTAQEYSAFFDKGEEEYGKFNGRTGDVLGIEIENDLATATADAMIGEYRYVDKYLLRRFDGEWKIISKASTRYKLPEE